MSRRTLCQPAGALSRADLDRRAPRCFGSLWPKPERPLCVPNSSKQTFVHGYCRRQPSDPLRPSVLGSLSVSLGRNSSNGGRVSGGVSAFLCSRNTRVSSSRSSRVFPENAQQKLPLAQLLHLRGSDTAWAVGWDRGRALAAGGRITELLLLLPRMETDGRSSDPQLAAEPAHGSAAVWMLKGAALIFYMPSLDYIGPDRFVVAFSRDYALTVDISVVPLP